MNLQPLTREMTCPCGESYTQTAIELEGRPLIWGPPTCSACTEARASRLRGNERERAVRARAALREIRVSALALPPLFESVCLEGFQVHGPPEEQAKQQHVLRLAEEYLTTWPAVPMLTVFTGEPGTGKGHIAWSLVKELVTGHAIAARVVKLADLVRDLRASWSGDSETEAKVLAGYRRLDLLVIDEVSRHAFYGQQIHQHLYDVLDHRLEWQRPTILTTNETEDGLAQILRPALIDRLQGHGGIVDFGAASWRAK